MPRTRAPTRAQELGTSSSFIYREEDQKSHGTERQPGIHLSDEPFRVYLQVGAGGRVPPLEVRGEQRVLDLLAAQPAERHAALALHMVAAAYATQIKETVNQQVHCPCNDIMLV